MEAVVAASPLAPFPAGIKEDHLKIRLSVKGKEVRFLKAFTTKGRINLDIATKTHLEALPGIGSAQAQAIIEYRAQHGRFRSIEEIKKVEGIDKITFREIENLVTVTTEKELKEVNEIVAKSWLRNGDTWADLGDYDSAIEHYERLIHYYPESKYAQEAKDRIIEAEPKLKRKTKSVPRAESKLTLGGIIGTPEGPVAFIEGRKTYWVKEGEEVEGWKVLKVEQNKVTLYKEEEKKGLKLYLGGRFEELENFNPGRRDIGE